MKTTFRSPLAGITGAFALALFAGMSAPAHALTWLDPLGGGTWDNTTANWGPGPVAWSPGAAAVFQGAGGAGNPVNIGDNLVVGSISFTGAAGPYEFYNTGGWQIDITGSGISTASPANQLIMSNGTINFSNSASAGTATIMIDSTSIVTFGNSATAGSSTLINTGQLTFSGSATSASSTITNEGNLEFLGAATGGSTTLVNGGTLDISGSTGGGVTLNSLNNDSAGLPGAVTLGLNTLTLSNGLSLSPNAGNALSFTLQSPASTTDGSIVITGGTFTGSVGAGSTTISLSGPATPGLPNVPFVLVDWSATGLASGVDVSDFTFGVGAGPSDIGLAGYSLKIQGNQLVLVPEPATLAMPLAAALGMLTLRRRRSARVS